MNAIIGIVIGIILILLWVPACFAFEFNNKANYEEQQRLFKKINDMSTAAADISLKGVKIESNIPMDRLPAEFKEHLKKQDNYYVEYRITTQLKDSNSQVELYTETVMYTVPEGAPEMTVENYKHLATAHGKRDVHFAMINTQQHELIIYKLLPEQVDRIRIVKGLLEVGDTETKNPYDIPIYTYEMGVTEDIRQEIIKRKQDSNTAQKWFGRLAVFCLLFGGLMLLISPLRQLRDTIPIISLLLDPIMALYGGVSFIFSLLATIVATAAVYMIVNYPTISMIFAIISGGAMVVYRNTLLDSVVGAGAGAGA